MGGNVANGSPIGDSAPVLIALGATHRAAPRRGARAMPLEDFYLDYMKNQLAARRVRAGRASCRCPGPASCCAPTS